MWCHWLIRSCFLLPLLLCVIGWSWSISHQTWAFWLHGGDRYHFYTGWGVVELEWEQKTHQADGWASNTSAIPARVWPTDERSPNSYLGFAFSHGVPPFPFAPAYQIVVAVPYWFLIVFFSLALLFVWRKTGTPKRPTGFPVETTGGQP